MRLPEVVIPVPPAYSAARIPANRTERIVVKELAALRQRLLIAAVALIAFVIGIAGCGSGEGDSGGGHPDYAKALAGAPAPLAALHRQSDELLDGGLDAYESRIEGLQGIPGRRQRLGIVVRALPVRVPLLPAGEREVRQAGRVPRDRQPGLRRRRGNLPRRAAGALPELHRPRQAKSPTASGPAAASPTPPSTRPTASCCSSSRAPTTTKPSSRRTSTATRWVHDVRMTAEISHGRLSRRWRWSLFVC